LVENIINLGLTLNEQTSGRKKGNVKEDSCTGLLVVAFENTVIIVFVEYEIDARDLFTPPERNEVSGTS